MNSMTKAAKQSVWQGSLRGSCSPGPFSCGHPTVQVLGGGPAAGVVVAVNLGLEQAENTLERHNGVELGNVCHCDKELPFVTFILAY